MDKQGRVTEIGEWIVGETYVINERRNNKGPPIRCTGLHVDEKNPLDNYVELDGNKYHFDGWKNTFKLFPKPNEWGSVFLGFEGEYPVFRVKASGRFRCPGGNMGCSLSFKCPVCGRINSHGGKYGKFGEGDGHRVSHCMCWPNGYVIKEVPK